MIPRVTWQNTGHTYHSLQELVGVADLAIMAIPAGSMVILLLPTCVLVYVVSFSYNKNIDVFTIHLICWMIKYITWQLLELLLEQGLLLASHGGGYVCELNTNEAYISQCRASLHTF